MQNEIFKQLRKLKITGETALIRQKMKNACGVMYTGRCMSKYVASFFNMIRIICTPQKCSGFNQMEEAKKLVLEMVARYPLQDS
jgi:hypothetical protein